MSSCKRHTWYVALLSLAVSGCTLTHSTDCNSVSAAEFMLGDWIAKSERRVTLESWIEAGDSTLVGTGEVRSADTNEVRSTEAMRVVEMGDGVFYLAKPEANPLPVAFELTRCATGTVVFENADHDFPKRIEYSADGKNRLVARVSDGGEEGFQINYRRVAR